MTATAQSPASQQPSAPAQLILLEELLRRASTLPHPQAAVPAALIPTEVLPPPSGTLASIVPVNPHMPATLEGKLRMAELLVKSGLCPKDFTTTEKVFVALQYGAELGLSPWIAVQNIAVVNGRPSAMFQVMLGIAQATGQLEDFDDSQCSDTIAIIAVKRRGVARPKVGRFDLEDAKRAGLIGKDIWQKYTRDMLRNRAGSRALKASFPEIFAGLLMPEEAEDLDAPPRHPAMPAWTMNGDRYLELKRVVGAKKIPADAVKAITRNATNGREVPGDEKTAVPQYTQDEFEALKTGFSEWKQPAPGGQVALVIGTDATYESALPNPHWKKVQQIALDANLNMPIGEAVKLATGRTKPSEITADDVVKFERWTNAAGDEFAGEGGK